MAPRSSWALWVFPLVLIAVAFHVVVADEKEDALLRLLDKVSVEDLQAMLEGNVGGDELRQAPDGRSGVDARGFRSVSKQRNEADEWLGDWARDKDSIKSIRRALQSGQFVVIKNALREDKAAAIYRTLDTTDVWKEWSGSFVHYQFVIHAVFPTDMPETPQDILEIMRVWESKSMLAIFESISDLKLDKGVQGGAMWLKPGDYISPHTDTKTTAAGAHRSLSFILHLAKGWPEDQGGDFTWCSPHLPLSPGYNSLILFPVSDDTCHFVTPVWREAPDYPRRYSWSGWWMSSQRPMGRARLLPAGAPAGVSIEKGRPAVPIKPDWLE